MRAYGYAAEAPGDFEEDHLIALELGGDPRDPRNLWPERLVGGSGALQKDRVENWAHDEVCAGRMLVADAQRRMAENWVELYNAMLAAIATPKATIAPAVVPTATPTIATSAAPATPPPSPALSVLISASRYGFVSATTLAGASCNAQARLPSGRISQATGLTATQLATVAGAVSWSYGTTTGTNPGTGTHTVTCVLGGVTRSASAPFTVQ
jgi:hypothetical protein